MRALTPFLSFGLDSGNPYVDHLRGARPWKFSIFSFPTRLLSRAIEWNANDKNNSFVLRGDDLRSAERWLAEAGAEKERQPTAPQTEYIIASRKAAARRQRITFGAGREAWVDWKDIRVALAALEGGGYFKLESDDREAKTKKLVWSVCVDPGRITALDGLSTRKMSAATWFSIPKKPTRHLLRKERPQTREGSKTSNTEDVT